jgi:hypothetical protein
MSPVPLAPRHFALCLCERCQLAGSGAFGPQPDGSPPLYTLRERSPVAPGRVAARRPSRRGSSPAPREVPHDKP